LEILDEREAFQFNSILFYQSEIKERKRKMNDVTEEKHNCRKGKREKYFNLLFSISPNLRPKL